MRKRLSPDEFAKRWLEFQSQSARQNFVHSFKLLYSSVVDGFTSDPRHFFLPIDDHGFHRGDGVFEAMKVVNQKIYLRKPHLDRLERSMQAIHLQPHFDRAELEAILAEAVKEVFQQSPTESHLLLRVYVTRGAGGFGVSVKESKRSHLYVVLTSFPPPTLEGWQKGVSLCFTDIPVKPAPFSRIKSLNYLPNVMMKTAALDQHHDFAVGFDTRGFITESATENVAIINAEGELCHPKWDSILDGCTLKRSFQLANDHKILPIRSGIDISKQDLLNAREVLMIGTTLDVTAVTKLDGQIRQRGPWAEALRELIVQDQK